MYDLKTAREQDLTQIYELYKGAIQKVNQGTVKLGWNIEIYPDLAFIKCSSFVKEKSSLPVEL